MSEPNFSIDFTALAVGTDGPIAIGDAIVYSASLGRFVVATAANRTAADSGTEALALTPLGAAPMGAVGYQASGVVAQEISNLPVVTAGSGNKLVRVSSSGRLERIDAYTDGDDVVGYAKPNGRVALHIGLPWQLIASAAGLITGRKVVYGDGLLAGAAHASISSDGYTEHSADRTGGAATVGDDRFAKLSSVMIRSALAAVNLCLWCITGSDQLFIGGIPGVATSYLPELYLLAKAFVGGSLTDQNDGGATQGFQLFRYALSTQAAFGLTQRVNLAFNGGNSSTPIANFGGGIGVAFWGVPAAIPTTNPANGYVAWTDPTTKHPMARMPDGTVFDLTDTGSSARPVKVVSSTGSLGTINLLVGGVAAGTVIFTGAGSVDINGFSPTPASGVHADVHIISNLSGEGSTLTLNDDFASTSAQGFDLDTSTVALPRGSYESVYDQTAFSSTGRWSLDKGYP